MVTLVLIRHAKSDWGHAGLADHDRPLNARGEQDAPRMAAALAARGVRPDRLLSSTALRARTTAATFADALGVDVELVPDLYGASPRTLTQQATASGADAVVIVAHDPGLSDLVSDLADREVAMPTCAVATFVWESDDWESALDEQPSHWNLDVPAR